MRKTPASLLLALSIIGCPALAAEEIALSAAQMQALGIVSASIEQQGAVTGTGLAAQVAIPAGQITLVSAPLMALVEHMAVATNEPVQEGQVLARLRSAALVEAQRAYLQAITQHSLARENAARDAQLFKEGIIAQSRNLATQSMQREVAANLAERRQMLQLYGMSDAALKKLEQGQGLSSVVELVAPQDGVVLEQMAHAGQRVEAAAPLYKLARLNPLWLEIQAPVVLLDALQTGAAVEVPAYQVQGKLISIGASVDQANQVVMVRAEITQGAERLRPAQFVEARIAGGADNGKQWRVPQGALLRAESKAYVFVQTPAGFRVQPVIVLSETAESSTVRAELRGDERIAVRGIAALKSLWQGGGG